MTSCEEIDRFKTMAADEKLNLSLNLYYSARDLKRAWLKLCHPDWDDKAVEEELKKIFMDART